MNDEGLEVRPAVKEEKLGRQLMLAFQKGDKSAFERLVVRYQAAVYHFLYRFLRDPNRAEDLTQEVFLRVFRSRRRYRPTAGFKTWAIPSASTPSLP